jgi:multicomponent Na+:H+ antiporter subunit E
VTNAGMDAKNPLMFGVVARRTLLFGLLWALLGSGESQSWIMGVPAIIFAVAISIKQAPSRSWRWRPLALLRFVPFFVLESLRGGWDVSQRVLRPSLPINPAIVLYTTHLPAGVPRMLLLNVTSLLPGTLSADLRDDCLTLHVLDNQLPLTAEIKSLEDRIAALFIFSGEGESG